MRHSGASRNLQYSVKRIKMSQIYVFSSQQNLRRKYAAICCGRIPALCILSGNHVQHSGENVRSEKTLSRFLSDPSYMKTGRYRFIDIFNNYFGELLQFTFFSLFGRDSSPKDKAFPASFFLPIL